MLGNKRIIEWMVFANFAFTPFTYMRFSSTYYKVMQVLIFGMLGMSILAWLYQRLIKKDVIYIPEKKASILLVLMVVYNLTASIFNLDTKASLVTACIMGVSLVYFILIYDVFKRCDIKEVIGKFAFVLNITMILFVIYQVLCVFKGSVNILKSIETGFYIERGRYLMRSMFENPNTLGLFAAIVVMANMLEFQVVKKNINRVYNVIISIVSIIVIVMTESRGGLLAAAIVIGLYVIGSKNQIIKFLKKKNIDVKKAVITICVVIVGMFLISLLFIDYTEVGMIKKFEGGLRGRVERWNLAFEVVNQTRISQVFGVGNLADMVGRYDFSYLYNSHNGFVNLLVRGGYGLLAMYIGFIVYIFYMVFRKYKYIQKEEDRNIVKCCCISIIAMLSQQMFEVGIIFSSITHFAAMSFWMIIAILFNIVVKDEDGSDKAC